LFSGEVDTGNHSPRKLCLNAFVEVLQEPKFQVFESEYQLTSKLSLVSLFCLNLLLKNHWTGESGISLLWHLHYKLANASSMQSCVYLKLSRTFWEWYFRFDLFNAGFSLYWFWFHANDILYHMLTG
jgi:hypothetical protein